MLKYADYYLYSLHKSYDFINAKYSMSYEYLTLVDNLWFLPDDRTTLLKYYAEEETTIIDLCHCLHHPSLSIKESFQACSRVDARGLSPPPPPKLEPTNKYLRATEIVSSLTNSCSPSPKLKLATGLNLSCFKFFKETNAFQNMMSYFHRRTINYKLNTSIRQHFIEKAQH